MVFLYAVMLPSVKYFMVLVIILALSFSVLNFMKTKI